MSSRRTQENPVSLFPFLAVLMSAMGALILLLLVVSRQAQQNRDREYAREEQRLLAELPPLPPRETFPEVEPAKVGDLPAVIRHELARLPDVKDRRSALLTEKTRLRAELETLKRAPPSAVDPEKNKRLAELARQIAEMEEILAVVRRAKEEALKSAKEKKEEADELEKEREGYKRQGKELASRYSIVPYTGPGGTNREPIYFECRAGKIILQPEGVAIVDSDLPDPSASDNTLAMMMRQLLTYERSRGGQPYPLLVVRPDGVATYLDAKVALSEVSGDYGYELVPEEKKLAFGEADEKVRELALKVLADERKKTKPPFVARAWRPDLLPGRGGSARGFGDSGGELPRMTRAPSDELEALARSLPDVRQRGRGPGLGFENNGDDPQGLGSRGQQNRGPLSRPFEGDDPLTPALKGRGGGGLTPSAEGIKSDVARGVNATGRGSGSGGVVDGVKMSPIGSGREEGGWQGDSSVVSGGASERPGGGERALGAGDSNSGSRQGRMEDKAEAGRAQTIQGDARKESGSTRGQGAVASIKPGAKQGSTKGSGGAGDASAMTEFEEVMMEGGAPGQAGMNMNMPMPSLSRNFGARSREVKGEPAPEGAMIQPELGPTGTIRHTVGRTVTVDCRESGVTLYPGGKFLPFETMTLDQVKREIYRHVAEQVRAWGAADALREYTPIVEFTVRPDGLGPYYDLRLAMARSGLEIRDRRVGWKEDLDFREFLGEMKPSESALRSGRGMRR